LGVGGGGVGGGTLILIIERFAGDGSGDGLFDRCGMRLPTTKCATIEIPNAQRRNERLLAAAFG
jgi:hypothetical protein